MGVSFPAFYDTLASGLYAFQFYFSFSWNFHKFPITLNRTSVEWLNPVSSDLILATPYMEKTRYREERLQGRNREIPWLVTLWKFTHYLGSSFDFSKFFGSVKYAVAYWLCVKKRRTPHSG